MNAKFYYAAPIFTNVPKLIVVTEDGVLYSEHKEYDVLKIDRKTNINFTTFNESDYECEDYPVLLEITYQEAREMPLNGQSNWIDRYASNKHITVQMAMQA